MKLHAPLIDTLYSPYTLGNTDVRLNRALEENTRLKAQLSQAQQAGRETDVQLQDRLQRFEAENKMLAKQKSELLVAFQKQVLLNSLVLVYRISVCIAFPCISHFRMYRNFDNDLPLSSSRALRFHGASYSDLLARRVLTCLLRVS